MKAILLDGSPVGDPTGERIRAALAARLEDQGWDVDPVVLRERRIGACGGDFLCWVRTPGVCNVDDDNRLIAAMAASSDLLVYLTPVTFGGYGSDLKRMVDRQIQNVLPFFAQVQGETHHQARYRHNPDLLAVGWADDPEAGPSDVFRHLVARNALNFHARHFVSDVVRSGASSADLDTAAAGWLGDLRDGRSSAPGSLPDDRPTVESSTDIGRALLLVGSPNTRTSTSNSLGGYLHERLAGHGIQTETRYLHTIVRSPARMRELLDAVEAADLVTLAFPLYVDCLPAPVTEVLEQIAVARRGRPSGRQRFAAIANNGFPEAAQNATALAICRAFAIEAGFEWAGGLALGGGAMVGGAPLVGGRTARIRASLDQAADALGRGEAIPGAARELLARPVIPGWAYRLLGTIGWHRLARRHGVRQLLRRRSYVAESAAA